MEKKRKLFAEETFCNLSVADVGTDIIFRYFYDKENHPKVGGYKIISLGCVLPVLSDRNKKNIL